MQFTKKKYTKEDQITFASLKGVKTSRNSHDAPMARRRNICRGIEPCKAPNFVVIAEQVTDVQGNRRHGLMRLRGDSLTEWRLKEALKAIIKENPC